MSRLSTLLDACLSALLPRACLLCGAAAPDILCAGCATDVPRLGAPLCPICAVPLGAPAAACGACLAHPPAYDATCAPLRYGFPVDALVHQLKYRSRLASAEFFARCMLAGPHPDGALILPVPLSAKRLKERGFNQALEIARPLARALALPIDSASLTRTRETLPQSRLPWRSRGANVKHAFACSRDLSGLAVIVVDDVMTTGATLDAIARVLKDHGATHVANWAATRALKTLA